MAVAAGMVGAAAVSAIATGIAGSAASADDRRRAKRLQQRALAAWQEVQPQDYSELRDYMKELAEANMIDPKTELAILQLDSEGRSKVGDPQALDAQRDALEYLTSVMETEGMTPQDQAYYFEIADKLDRDSKIAHQNIMANMQQRGVAGGGQELAAKLSQAQGAQQARAREAVDLAAMALGRKDQAAQQSGQLGLQMRGQQFQEAATRDRMLMGARAQNFGMGSQAAQFDYSTRQAEFDQQAQKAQGMSGQYNQMAQQANLEGQQEAAQWANIGQAVSQAAGSLGQYSMQQNYMDRAFPNPDTPQQVAAPSGSLSGVTPQYAGLFADPDELYPSYED